MKMKISARGNEVHEMLIILGFLLSVMRVAGEQSLAEKAEMFAQLGKLPLSKNPFFIKNIAMSGQFDGEGEEGITPDFTGYSCRWIGNLECQNFKFQCDGSGIVDCTGDCPGDEEAVTKMMNLLEDKELQKEFPILAKMKEEMKKNPEKAKAGKERFIKVLKGCGFNGLAALAGLSGESLDFSGGSNDNNSITHVDDSAISGFGYSYDYYAEETNHEEEEPLPEPESSDQMAKDAHVAVTEPVTDSMSSEKMKKIESESSTMSLENETALKKSESHINSPQKVSTEVTDIDKSLRQVPKKDLTEETKSVPLNKQPTSKTNDEMVLKRLNSEVEGLREVFLTALDNADGIEPVRQKRSSQAFDLLASLTKDLRQMEEPMRRRIRSVAEDMSATITNATMEVEKCKVQNLSCVAFPTTAQCKGIAMGGCMSHSKLLASIFTPRVVMMVVFAILVIILIGVGIAVYIHKRKNVQTVEPADGEDPNSGKGPQR